MSKLELRILDEIQKQTIVFESIDYTLAKNNQENEKLIKSLIEQLSISNTKSDDLISSVKELTKTIKSLNQNSK